MTEDTHQQRWEWNAGWKRLFEWQVARDSVIYQLLSITIAQAHLAESQVWTPLSLSGSGLPTLFLWPLLSAPTPSHFCKLTWQRSQSLNEIIFFDPSCVCLLLLRQCHRGIDSAMSNSRISTYPLQVPRLFWACLGKDEEEDATQEVMKRQCSYASPWKKLRNEGMVSQEISHRLI